MFGKMRMCTPESENVTTTVEVFHQQGGGSLGEGRKLSSPVVQECLALSKTFLIYSLQKESGSKWKLCKLHRFIFSCNVLETFASDLICHSYWTNQFCWAPEIETAGEKKTPISLHVGRKRHLAGRRFSSHVHRSDAKRTALCVVMVYLYCKVAARVMAGHKQREINQEKKGSSVKLPLCDEAPTVSCVCIS